MEDIVERLRNWLAAEEDFPLRVEAADEIERLRRIADAAVDWRKCSSPDPVPFIQPQAMSFTALYRLQSAVDEYAGAPNRARDAHLPTP